jgi:putative endonuclease
MEASGRSKGTRTVAEQAASRHGATERPSAPAPTTKARGDAGEQAARRYLERQGLVILAENWRVARGPHARGGEIDLIARDPDGTLVFVEVRQRSGTGHGGAAATVTRSKQRRIVFAAQSYLQGLPRLPPCRFDVVAIDGDAIEWLRGAFDTSR